MGSWELKKKKAYLGCTLKAWWYEILASVLWKGFRGLWLPLSPPQMWKCRAGCFSSLTLWSVCVCVCYSIDVNIPWKPIHSSQIGKALVGVGKTKISKTQVNAARVDTQREAVFHILAQCFPITNIPHQSSAPQFSLGQVTRATIHMSPLIQEFPKPVSVILYPIWQLGITIVILTAWKLFHFSCYFLFHLLCVSQSVAGICVMIFR